MEYKRSYWVSNCCLAQTNVQQPPASRYSDSPPDPVVTCDCCEQKCEEWGLTQEEYRDELEERGKDPELYINEEDEEFEATPEVHPRKV
jgi:hypothetical protein